MSEARVVEWTGNLGFTAASESVLVAPAPGVSPTGACRVERLAADRIDRWNAYVERHEHGTVFHGWAWRDAVRSAFGHEPIYLGAFRDRRLVGGLPLFFVRSRFAGRLLVSVPYGVAGGILADDDAAAVALFDEAKRIAEARRCVGIDLRSAHAPVPGVPVVDRYVGFERELPDETGDVLKWLPRKARAAARNGREKFGLKVDFDDEHLRRVWTLYSISMRRLASLAYPFSFFEKLIERTPGRHWVSLVTWRGRPVAGLLTLLFRDRVMPYFIGTTDEARRCSAANFAYLTIMERGVEEGYRVFDFGRSRRDNAGSYDFKRFHGFSPRPLAYQYVTMAGRSAPNLSPTNPRFRLARRLWTHLPLRVTRIAGAYLAKHIPG